jgi:hypothetical protein
VDRWFIENWWFCETLSPNLVVFAINSLFLRRHLMLDKSCFLIYMSCDGIVGMAIILCVYVMLQILENQGKSPKSSKIQGQAPNFKKPKKNLKIQCKNQGIVVP